MVKNKADISIVILNYNAGNFLLKCVHSIKQSHLDGIKAELIIVDNGSTDGSIETLQGFRISGIRFEIIQNKKNLGFAKGNNIGARTTSGRYVLFLNPDTLLSKDSLKRVFEFMEQHKNAGAASPILKLADGSIDESSHRGFPTPWNALSHFSGLEKIFCRSHVFSGYTMGWLLDKKKPHEVDAISGAFFFVRRQAAEEVSWWDEDYFWYGEDLDFCYRLKSKGWKIFSLPEVDIVHFRGISSGIKRHSQGLSSAFLTTRLAAAQASTEAMKIFYKKHYLNRYPKIVTSLVLLGINILAKLRVAKIRLL